MHTRNHARTTTADSRGAIISTPTYSAPSRVRLLFCTHPRFERCFQCNAHAHAVETHPLWRGCECECVCRGTDWPVGRSVAGSAGCFDQGRIMASGHLSPRCGWDIGTEARVCVYVCVLYSWTGRKHRSMCVAVDAAVCVYVCWCVYVYRRWRWR